MKRWRWGRAGWGGTRLSLPPPSSFEVKRRENSLPGTTSSSAASHVRPAAGRLPPEAHRAMSRRTKMAAAVETTV